MTPIFTKLHLGCGEVHLDGYLNIDFPPVFHTIQTTKAADEYHNILELSYQENSIEEVRLHHVFEHFSRPIAIALVASWWSWLKPGGRLHIEVPDFDRTVLIVLNPFTSKRQKGIALRHIFGSQEASWAIHLEGWSSKRLRLLLENSGFVIETEKRNSYKGTHNFEIHAIKTSKNLDKEDFSLVAKNWLTNYMVDDSSTEIKMLSTWINDFSNQLAKTWASK